MTKEELRHYCREIYSDPKDQHWQSSLARDLDIKHESVRNWVKGNTRVPEYMFTALVTIINDKIKQLTEQRECILDIQKND